MKRIAIAATAVLLLSSAVARANGPATAAKKPAVGLGAPGKPRAPVSIDAKLGADRATVTVRFHSPATAADVEVHGVDGLVVTSSATPLSGVRFARGEAVSFDVSFTPGPGQSHLAVSVTATSGGSRRSTVTSFAVGQPSAEQQKASGEAATDSTGRRIKVLPAETR
jgi:hypothetical protein